MTFNYAKSQSTAERLIANFGQTGTLTQIANSGTAYNPTRVETDYTVTCAVLDFSNRDIDGSIILSGDKMAYLSTEDLTVTPTIADKITINSVVHQIMNVNTLSPAGTVVYYKIQVRR